MREPPSAAQALYPHLPSAERREVKQSERTLAEAMYPRPQAKPPNPYRESLLRNLRETIADLRRR
jgi:hypothetical protein